MKTRKLCLNAISHACCVYDCAMEVGEFITQKALLLSVFFQVSNSVHCIKLYLQSSYPIQRFSQNTFY